MLALLFLCKSQTQWNSASEALSCRFYPYIWKFQVGKMFDCENQCPNQQISFLPSSSTWATHCPVCISLIPEIQVWAVCRMAQPASFGTADFLPVNCFQIIIIGIINGLKLRLLPAGSSRPRDVNPASFVTICKSHTLNWSEALKMAQAPGSLPKSLPPFLTQIDKISRSNGVSGEQSLPSLLQANPLHIIPLLTVSNNRF